MNTIHDNAHALTRKSRRNLYAWLRRHYPQQQMVVVTGTAHLCDPATMQFNGKTMTILHVKNLKTNMEETFSLKGIE